MLVDALEISNYGMGKRQTLTVGRERFLVGPWHADPSVAYLTSQPISDHPSLIGLQRCVEILAEREYRSIITAALHLQEAALYQSAGFTELDRLRVLSHDFSLSDPPRIAPSGQLRLRRARRLDRPAALSVDNAAFPVFWRLDADGLREALDATSRTRFRVAQLNGSIVGYSVTGRSGSQGFLQRLATAPEHAGAGIGSALVMDALAWARRWRASRMFVNTPATNDRALALYSQLGFTLTPVDLVVMELTLR